MTEIVNSSAEVTELDVAVIGTGFGGLYALHKFRNELGLNVQAFDDAGDVGGTWYWNRYPGCRVDTEATVYCYSFDKELLRNWKWSERYPRQPEVLAYLSAVAAKHVGHPHRVGVAHQHPAAFVAGGLQPADPVGAAQILKQGFRFGVGGA